MTAYKTVDLINKLSELINDGFEYVSVCIIDADDECLESLMFEAIESPVSSIDFEDVEQVEVPEDYDYEEVVSHKVKGTDTCLTLPFTYQELADLSYAVDVALDYTKECSKNPSCSREEREDMKISGIHWRNLQAKFAKFNKRFRIHQK